MSVGAVNKQTGERIPTAGMPAVDSVLSGTSTNPVQNRVVKAALDEKANTDMVAADFNAGTSYTAGNYCIYEGKFYKFKASHSGAWSASDVDEIKIAGELSSLKSGLINLTKVYKAIKYVDLAAGADTWVDIYPSDFGLTGSIDMTTMGILAFGYGDYGAICTVQANNGGGDGYVMSAEHSFKIYVKSGAEGSARFYITIILVN